MDEEASDVPQGPPRLAAGIVYASLVPAALLTVWLVSIPPEHPWREATATLLTLYATSLALVSAGLRLGLDIAHAGEHARRDMVVSVLPAALVWLVPMLAPPHSFVLLAVVLAAQGAWDNYGVHGASLPAWFGRIRVRFTFMLVAAMIAAFLVTV